MVSFHKVIVTIFEGDDFQVSFANSYRGSDDGAVMVLHCDERAEAAGFGFGDRVEALNDLPIAARTPHERVSLQVYEGQRPLAISLLRVGSFPDDRRWDATAGSSDVVAAQSHSAGGPSFEWTVMFEDARLGLTLGNGHADGTGGSGSGGALVQLAGAENEPGMAAVVVMKARLPATAHGIQPGDVLLRVGGEPVPRGKHHCDLAKAVGLGDRPVYITFLRQPAVPNISGADVAGSSRSSISALPAFLFLPLGDGSSSASDGFNLDTYSFPSLGAAALALNAAPSLPATAEEREEGSLASPSEPPSAFLTSLHRELESLGTALSLGAWDGKMTRKGIDSETDEAKHAERKSRCDCVVVAAGITSSKDGESSSSIFAGAVSSSVSGAAEEARAWFQRAQDTAIEMRWAS